jgi:hypothetical protein
MLEAQAFYLLYLGVSISSFFVAAGIQELRLFLLSSLYLNILKLISVFFYPFYTN